jgi:RND family efflux transporter MFP subunit
MAILGGLVERAPDVAGPGGQRLDNRARCAGAEASRKGTPLPLRGISAEQRRPGIHPAAFGAFGESDIDANLLNELRIEGRQREDEGGGRPRWLWPVLGILLAMALLAGAGGWYLSTRSIAVQTAAAVAVGAGGGAAATVLQATGYVTARRQATVSTQITGTLTQVLIEEGDRVQKGQVIARLEDSGLRAGLNVARANISSAEAQVAQADAQLTQARADARRQEELAASGMLSKQAAEQARTAAVTAAAQLEARRREAESSRAQLAQAQVNFDYTVVRAPFSGVVTVKAAQVGEIVSPLSAGGGFTRTGVGTIVDMESLEVDVDVNEAYIGQVRPDMPTEAVLDAYPDWKIPSHVIAIVPSADRGKATVKVRIALEQKDARLVPDMGVRVSFLAAKPVAAAPAPKGVLVPAQALTERGGARVVFVVVDGKAQQRKVTPATQDVGTMKRLPDAVQAGERVVLSPPPSLHDGAEVRIDAEPH